ncbi:MAG: histidine kinase dimerization/phospho-acceptor domain-containing protein [Elusimicrobiota bacterium]
MKKSIFLKIFSLYLLIIILLSSSILFFTFKSIKSHYLNSQVQNLININNALELKILPLIENKQTKELEVLIKSLDKTISTRITVINAKGIVLADSENDPKLMENRKYRPEVLKALNGEIGQSVRISLTNKEEMLYVARPLREKGKIIGVLRVSLFLKQINILLDSLKNRIFHIVIIILVISFILSFIFSRSLAKPIRILAEASNKIAEGNFESRIYLKNNDEFKLLADSFNYMASEIKTSLGEISHQKEELNSIISSIQEGLVLLNRENKIILFNKAFVKLAGMQNLENKFIWEIIRDPKLNELIKKIRLERKNTIDEIELNEKSVLLSTATMETNNEVVLILYDITEFKKLGQIKKDFVANVSHELKTPLTAIKGFVETMEEEERLNKRYLDVIKRNIDRLMNIVGDLSALSSLEDKSVQPDFQKVNLKEAIENASKDI